MSFQFPDIITASAIVALTGESPLWDQTRGVLWWIDVQGQMLNGLQLNANAEQCIALPSMPGLVALADDGNLVVGLEDGLWHLVPEAKQATQLAVLPDPDPRLRTNDGKADKMGRLWFGTMDKTGSGARIGSIMRRETDGTVTRVVQDLTTPNAIAFSPDGGRFYYADTSSRRLMVADMDQTTGEIAHVSVLIEFESTQSPDGMAVDAKGDLWLALPGEGIIGRYSDDGALLGRVRLPVSRPTMPCFAGPALDRMFITSQRRFLSFEALSEQPQAGMLIEQTISAVGLQPSHVKI